MRTVQVTSAFTIHSIPASAIVLTGVVSVTGLVFASLLGWPLWRIALADTVSILLQSLHAGRVNERVNPTIEAVPARSVTNRLAARR